MESTRSGIIDQSNTPITPASRIAQVFERAKQEQRGALMPYLMSGHPNAAQSVQLVLAAARGGADIIELGMPFSDPLADGATVQHAGQVALEGGMTIKGCMQVASQIAAHSTVPLILMGYYNPLISYGIERFCEEARASGVCGMIIPDLPVEEAEPLQAATQRHGLALIFLLPPTTPDERIISIVEQSVQGQSGFIYCVSLSGVTGSRQNLPPHLRSFIERVRRFTAPKNLPLAVGFGLSTPEHIAEVTSFADGAVVGSALINLIDRHEEGEQVQAVEQYIRSLRQGLYPR